MFTKITDIWTDEQIWNYTEGGTMLRSLYGMCTCMLIHFSHV